MADHKVNQSDSGDGFFGFFCLFFVPGDCLSLMMAVFMNYMLNTGVSVRTVYEHVYVALRISVTKRVLIGMHRIIVNTYSFVDMLSERNEREVKWTSP